MANERQKMKKLLGVGLLAGVALLSACSPASPSTTQPVQAPVTAAPASNNFQIINAQQAKQMMDQSTGYVIVDVRTQSEFQDGHIDGAVLIPVDQVASLAPSKLPDKTQLIFVYCRSGARAQQASTILAQMGYTNVVDFGGISSWPYGTVTG